MLLNGGRMERGMKGELTWLAGEVDVAKTLRSKAEIRAGVSSEK